MPPSCPRGVSGRFLTRRGPTDGLRSKTRAHELPQGGLFTFSSEHGRIAVFGTRTCALGLPKAKHSRRCSVDTVQHQASTGGTNFVTRTAVGFYSLLGVEMLPI